MKRSSLSRSHGFTLVELLVVMGIIAILAGVILSVFPMLINMAKRAKAQNTATQMQTAVLSYYTEYSVYPVPTGVTADYGLTDTDGVLGGATANSWGPLIECLSGMIKPCNGQVSTETTFTNTRQIAFLNMKASDVATASATDPDAPLNPIPPNTTQLYFNIAFDADYDGIIGGSDTTSGTWLPSFSPPTVGSGTFPNTGGSTTSGVAVWANAVGSTKINSNWWVHTY